MANSTYYVPKILRVHLKLAQYPILAKEIRHHMRQELFLRGVITPAAFEQEVEEKAILSQVREGINDPFNDETAEVWEERISIIRDYLTDFYFAYNLPLDDLLEELIQSALANRTPDRKAQIGFNPELAPWAILFSQAETYETLPPEERAEVKHHLREILVILIKGLLSDHLKYVGVGKEFINIFDLKDVWRNRRIGRGKIGGKAAGMLLAYKILQAPDPDDTLNLAEHVAIPESYYLGADVFYDFMSLNDLLRFMNQKYKGRDEIERDYPMIRAAYLQGRFPEYVIKRLRSLLADVGNQPLIVRSSSLLEDRFDTAFAGKYDSFFCPNQGTPKENLKALIQAILKVYASTLSPDVLLYRQHMGLVDYDERMAVMIQCVQGQPYKDYFFPALAGVGFSRNPFRWNRKIKREEGFLRLVLGLGTRAVDRVANDYPRMIALSHPQLRPETTKDEIRKYSQHYVDLIDLANNECKTVGLGEVLDREFPAVQYLASVDMGDYVQPIFALGGNLAADKLVLTFDNLLKNTSFVPLMKAILNKLELHYNCPVDVEFTVDIVPSYPYPEFKIYILQCRPLSQHELPRGVSYPTEVPPADIIFTANRLIPNGYVNDVRYVVYVDPEAYDRIPDTSVKLEIGRAVGRLNKALAGETFILVGPGRWGSSNIDLGVKVTYADIFNTRLLAEVAMAHGGEAPEVSYGTHFFQDLVEARIFPLPLYPNASGNVFNTDFFNHSPNHLARFSPGDAALADFVRVIDVQEVSGGKLLEIVMDGEQDRAIGYVNKPSQAQGELIPEGVE
ncbi:MAG: PEP/pyruvate-binding domain-containing protein [Anaerolineae bacterium]